MLHSIHGQIALRVVSQLSGTVLNVWVQCKFFVLKLITRPEILPSEGFH